MTNYTIIGVRFIRSILWFAICGTFLYIDYNIPSFICGIIIALIFGTINEYLHKIENRARLYVQYNPIHHILYLLLSWQYLRLNTNGITYDNSPIIDTHPLRRLFFSIHIVIDAFMLVVIKSPSLGGILSIVYFIIIYSAANVVLQFVEDYCRFLKLILNNEQLNNLKEYVMNNDYSLTPQHTIKIKPDDVCCVCLENYITADILRVFGCMHHLHKQCGDPWISIHDSCPICRQPVLQTT